MNEKLIVSMLVVAVLSGCNTVPSSSTSMSPAGLRTIILDGESFEETQPGSFITYRCHDYVYGGRVLVEFGYYDPEIYPLRFGMGFVLYDGSNEGSFAFYKRSGLEREWYWDTDEEGNFSYTFTIKPDGVGAYFDFTNAEAGETVKAREVYKCYS